MLFFSYLLLPVVVLADSLAVVSINQEEVLGEVNRLILGNNIIGFNAKFKDKGRYANYGAGVWDPAKGEPDPEYVKLARQAGISIIRWPGGNHSRTMNWKESIGPASKRPNQKFGLPDFLRFCKEVDAEALIVVANQLGNKDDAADLVEYLNAPNDGSNPNGGEDWALQRAIDGHPEPIGAHWFVLGNETHYTNMSATSYAMKYKDYRTAMKNVDPDIKLGAVLEDSNNIDDGWSSTVFEELGAELDFADFHPYFPKISKQKAKHYTKHQMALAAVSSDADLIYRLKHYQALAVRTLGRSDFPVVATEFNGLYIQDEPIPFRQTLVNAIHNADFVRIMLQPEYNVAAANFWHFSNGYWGMVKGYPHKKEALIKQANYFVFELYNRYLGGELLVMQITSPTFEFEGCCSVSSRFGLPSERTVTALLNSDIPQSWSRRLFSDGTQSQDDGVLTVVFDENKDINYHHAKKIVPVEPDTIYKVSVKIKTDGLINGKVGIEIQDARGWKETFSRSRNISVTGTTPWAWVTSEYRTLPNAKAIKVLARRYKGSGSITGQAQFGEMKIEKIVENLGAVESLVGVASRSLDEKNLYLILINKDLYNEVVAQLPIPSGFRIAEAETLNGSNPYLTNLVSGSSDKVSLSPMKIDKIKDGAASLRLPALSVTGIRLERLQ